MCFTNSEKKERFHPCPFPTPFKQFQSQNKFNSEITGVDVAALRKWFIPMLGRYCEIMGVDCNLRGGCGFTDDCKLNEDCMVIDPKKETYKCVGE